HLGLDWEKYVVVDPEFYRPAEVDLLVSDPSQARAKLGWEPTVTFSGLIQMMADADLEQLKQARLMHDKLGLEEGSLQ
ncbi:MAG: GDP-mannose 4,6-dehydratase, partial [Anaerolineae bacterium]